MFITSDLNTCAQADRDYSQSLRGWVRLKRRQVKRCWWDQQTIAKPRIFCQNSGACGSTFIVKLLTENGISRVFHEKTPDLYQIGLDHFENPLSTRRLIRLLRYTRHDTFFEANNRLFSLTREIAAAFPNAHFIHLHRDGTEAVRSAMSKPDVANYLRKEKRFHGSLAGPHEASPFERCCHHWANMNQRIAEDSNDVQRRLNRTTLTLRFEDLIAGNLEVLESLLGQSLTLKSCSPANVGNVRSEGKFPSYSDWSVNQKQTFDRICSPVMALLGR